MRIRSLSLSSITRLVPLLVALSGCVAPRVDITPRLGQFDVDGDIGVSTTSVTATNSVKDAGLQDDESVFGGRVDLTWGGVHLTASAQKSNHDGDGVLEADLSQGGVTITAGTTVASELDLGLYSGIVTFDLIPVDNFELGLGLGATVVDFDASFTDTGSGDRVATDESVPIPLLAARAGAAFGPVDLSALAGGMKVKFDGDDASYVDLDLMARLRVLGGGERLTGWVALGWRQVDLNVDYDDGDDSVEVDMQFSGPYLGITLAF